MTETSSKESPSGNETARELAYAVPSGLVIFVHVTVALVAIGGAVNGISTLETGTDPLYRALIPLAVLESAPAAIGLSVALWSRRRWWIIAVPVCTTPRMVIRGFAYMAMAWTGY